MKKSIYKELKSEYKSASKGMPRNLSDELVAGKKGFAHGLMEQIAEEFPILKNLNSRDGALLNAEEYLTKAVNRVHNHEIGGLALDIGSPIVGGAIGGYEGRGGGAGGIGGGIAGGAALGMGISRALKNPAFMSRLAFALNKASKLSGSPLVSTAAKELGYGAGKVAPTVAEAFTSSAHAEELPPEAKSAFALTNRADDIYKGGYSDLNSPQRPTNIRNQGPATGNMVSASLSGMGDTGKSGKQYGDEKTESVSGMTNEQNATNAYLNGDYSKAIDYFRRAIKESPKMASKYKQAINTILQEKRAVEKRGYKVAENVE